MKITRRYWVLVVLAATSLSAMAGEEPLKPILLRAITSESGEASGILSGEMADKIHTTTGSYDPIKVEIKTLKRYKQEGCSRLSAKLIQPNVPTKEGGRTDFALNYELDLCKDGSPPMSHD